MFLVQHDWLEGIPFSFSRQILSFQLFPQLFHYHMFAAYLSVRSSFMCQPICFYFHAVNIPAHFSHTKTIFNLKPPPSVLPVMYFTHSHPFIFPERAPSLILYMRVPSLLQITSHNSFLNTFHSLQDLLLVDKDVNHKVSRARTETCFLPYIQKSNMFIFENWAIHNLELTDNI